MNLPNHESVNRPKTGRGFNALGLRLLRDHKPGANCFVSPLSIGIALSMLEPGARANTLAELKALLAIDLDTAALGREIQSIAARLGEHAETNFDWDQETGKSREIRKAVLKLHLANALFVQERYPIRQDCRDALKRWWSTDCYSVDFAENEAAAARINDWVAEHTNDFIQKLVDPEMLSAMTAMVLVNAIYFFAEWKSQFQESETRPAPFYDSAARRDELCRPPMMRATRNLNYHADTNLEAVELPFKATSMLVVVPKENSLEALEADLNVDGLWTIADGMANREVALEIPKFEIESSFSLSEALKAYGLREAFENGKADFSGLTNDPRGAFISEVVHRARIRVDENGVEAAAATAIMAVGAGFPAAKPEPIPVRVDHPFLFCIIDRVSRVILFAGRVMRPDE